MRKYNRVCCSAVYYQIVHGTTNKRRFFWGDKKWSEGFKKQTMLTNWQNGRGEWRPAEKAGKKSERGARKKVSRCPPTTAGSEKCFKR